MRNGLLVVCAMTLFWSVTARASITCPIFDPNGPQIVFPPAGYNRFYTKAVNVGGLPILATAKTCDRTLQMASEIVRKMLSRRPDVEAQLMRQRSFIAIFAVDERLTDLPEMSDLAGRPIPGDEKNTYDGLCGSGGSAKRPTVVCERNLIGYYDPYGGRMSVMIHELGHTIQDMGLDASSKRRIVTAYNNALRAGLFPPAPGSGTPWIMMNEHEFFACGTANWFNATDPGNPSNSPAQSGRAQLRSYAPELYQILSEIYPDDNWRYPRW